MHGSGTDFTALEMKYHKACYRTYLNKVPLSGASKNSRLKKKAFAALLKHVDKLVIKQNVLMLVSSLLKNVKLSSYRMVGILQFSKVTRYRICAGN